MTMHKNSINNLKQGPAFDKEQAKQYQAKGAETKRRKGIIRKALLESLYYGHMELKASEIELIDSNELPLKIDLSEIKIKVPNYVVILYELLKSASEGNLKAIQLIIELDENYRNRELKAKTKKDQTNTNLIEHIGKLTVKSPNCNYEPYDSLGRTPE